MWSLPGTDTEQTLVQQIFAALAAVYAGTRWAINPASDEDTFLIHDTKDEIMRLDPALWGLGLSLVADAHRRCLARTGQAPPPLKVPKR